MSSTATRTADPSLGQRPPYDMANGCRSRQTNTTRPYSKEDPPRHNDATVFTKVQSQGFANVREQRQVVHHPAFAADDDLASPPANILEFERDDFARAQTKSSQEEQDCVIPVPTEFRSVRRRQYTFYFVGRKKCGRHSLTIFADHGNRIGEVPRSANI